MWVGAAIIAAAMVGVMGAGSGGRAEEAAPPSEDRALYVGSYVDADNPSTRMEITEDEGLLRVRAGNESYAYELACLVTQAKAACMGNGGKLEGENFLYESMIEFAADGTAVETWKVFNNQQAAEGATNWHREQ
jgi:hypothetical protein